MTEIPNENYAWKAFVKNTKDHELTVIREDGLYRHLRLAEPGTRMWSIDITTWPGHLATTGDIGSGFMFSRESDMIGFFDKRGDWRTDYGAPEIDFRYWAEKLCERTIGDVYKHSPCEFMNIVNEAVAEYVNDGNTLSDDDRAVLMAEARQASDDAREAYEFLADNEDVLGSDSWELNFTEIDFQFALACYAIERIVTDYRAGRYTRVES